MKNSADITKYHDRFIREAVEKETVWGLISEDGWATSSSNTYKDENGMPGKLICFWSDEKRARVCQKKHWPGFQAEEIPLIQFMENWLVGMDQDGAIAGINFDWNLYGSESPTLNLLIELFDALKAGGKTLTFEKYARQSEFEDMARELLDS